MDTQIRQQLQNALTVVGVDAALVGEEELEKLWRHGYRSVAVLQKASRRGLLDAGLMCSTVDVILHGKEADPGPIGVGAADLAALRVMIQKSQENMAAMVANMNMMAANMVEKNKAVRVMQKSVRHNLKPLSKLLMKVAFAPKSAPSALSSYRTNAILKYTGEQRPSTLICAVSGILLPASEVKAGHIYQRLWLRLEGLNFKCDHESNILLLQTKVEEAFDKFQITILPVHYKTFLLNQDMANKVAFEYSKIDDTTATSSSSEQGSTSAGVKMQVKWGDLHNKELSGLDRCQPSNIALQVHAKIAFEYAVDYGWLSKDDLPALDFGDMDIMQQFLSASSTSDEDKLDESESGFMESGLEESVTEADSAI